MSEFDPRQDGSATEAPTPRRREQARAQGQFLESQELTTSVQLVTGWLAMLWSGPLIAGILVDAWHEMRLQLKSQDWSGEITQTAAMSLAKHLLMSCVLPIVLLVTANLLLSLLKRGGSLTMQPMRWNWGKLSPQNGISKIFSQEAAIRGLWALLKVTGVFLIGGSVLWQWRDRISTSGTGTTHALLSQAWAFSLKIYGTLAAASLVIGVSDLFAQWRRHEARLMMTREELKQEMKEEQGDPHLKAFLRRRQREQLKQRSVKDVPKATVVITNPTHVAVAIQYLLGSNTAPRVLAKGTDELAKRIKEIARQHQIHMVENKPLARALYQTTEIGQEIPPEFYRAIAEILAKFYQQRPV